MVRRGHYFWLQLHSSAHVVTDVNQLPIRVASHFTLDLRADGWLNRSSYLIVMAATGLALSLTIAAVAVATRMAHVNFIGRDSLWFGCYFLVFIYSVHRLIVRANRTDPPRLAKAAFLGGHRDSPDRPGNVCGCDRSPGFLTGRLRCRGCHILERLTLGLRTLRQRSVRYKHEVPCVGRGFSPELTRWRFVLVGARAATRL